MVFLPSLHATVQLLPSLTSSVVSRAIQIDSSGNIYVAGFYVPAAKNGYSAFVAKLTPAGSQIYFQPLGGSFNDYGTALAIGSDGSVYVAGDTNAHAADADGADEVGVSSGAGSADGESFSQERAQDALDGD